MVITLFLRGERKQKRFAIVRNVRPNLYCVLEITATGVSPLVSTGNKKKSREFRDLSRREKTENVVIGETRFFDTSIIFLILPLYRALIVIIFF